MPVTSEDLWVISADQSNREKLDKALAYIQDDMPVNGKASIDEFVTKRDVRIELNSNGEISYDHQAKVLKWDPSQALEIYDDDGNFVGVNSAASLLLHEINHALDENWEVNLSEEGQNARWMNDAERYAVQRTNDALAEAGEVQRVKYRGDIPIAAPDPTERTLTADYYDQYEIGSPENMVWVQLDLEFGDVFGDFAVTDLLDGMPLLCRGGLAGPLWPEISPDAAYPGREDVVSHEGVELIAQAGNQFIVGWMPV